MGAHDIRVVTTFIFDPSKTLDFGLQLQDRFTQILQTFLFFRDHISGRGQMHVEDLPKMSKHLWQYSMQEQDEAK
jgi:hypothetical protein